MKNSTDRKGERPWRFGVRGRSAPGRDREREREEKTGGVAKPRTLHVTLSFRKAGLREPAHNYKGSRTGWWSPVLSLSSRARSTSSRARSTNNTCRRRSPYIRARFVRPLACDSFSKVLTLFVIVVIDRSDHFREKDTWTEKSSVSWIVKTN